MARCDLCDREKVPDDDILHVSGWVICWGCASLVHSTVDAWVFEPAPIDPVEAAEADDDCVMGLS